MYVGSVYALFRAPPYSCAKIQKIIGISNRGRQKKHTNLKIKHEKKLFLDFFFFYFFYYYVFFFIFYFFASFFFSFSSLPGSPKWSPCRYTIVVIMHWL